MAAISGSKKTHTPTFKRTSQGGRRPKTSKMNKSEARSFKSYRGQGR